jgi:MFS family permease
MIEALGWTRSQASVAQGLNALMWGFFSPATAFSVHRLGARRTMLIGLTVALAGLFLMGTTISRLWQWTILWGFIVPFGLVFTGQLPIQTIVVHWFDRRRSAAMGLVLTGGPMGGFLAQPLFAGLMQRTDSWRIGWLAAALFVLPALALCFFIKNDPRALGQEADGIEPDHAGSGSAGPAPKGHRTYRTPDLWTLKAALSTRTLYLIMSATLAHSLPLSLIMTHGVLHFTDLGFSRMAAASILSFTALGSGLARFPAGWLGDRVEPRWILTAALSLEMMAFIGLWLAPSLTALLALGPLFGFCFGASMVMIPTVLGNYYGPHAFAGLSGFLAPVLVTFEALVPVGGGLIADRTGSYDLAFLLLSAVILAGVVASALMAPPKPRISTISIA